MTWGSGGHWGAFLSYPLAQDRPCLTSPISKPNPHAKSTGYPTSSLDAALCPSLAFQLPAGASQDSRSSFSLKTFMAVASTALQSPAPTPSHPFSPPFTPLLQPQASQPPRKANSMQPRDLCTCRFIRPGCSARTLPSGPSPLSTHTSLPLRSRPSPPWLKWPL